MVKKKRKTIPRDISWLSFNARVLQEAADPTVPLYERVRFLGIFSNNLDEFFRVRVATLRRMMEVGTRKNMHLEINPESILEEIQTTVLQQQNEFNRIWEHIQQELKVEQIFLKTEKQLSKEQKKYVEDLFEQEIRNNVIPLMIESLTELPYLRDKSIYLGVVMNRKDQAYSQKYALIEVPSKALGRFFLLPAPAGQHHIILLEDIIRHNLPLIFSYFGYNHYESHVFKVTKDAEIDLDTDFATGLIQKIEKGLKNRRKGKTTRFVYDREMNPGLLEFLIRKLNLHRRDNIIPGGRIHNFRHFMDFPESIFKNKSLRRPAFVHPFLKHQKRVTDVILQRDIMLVFPYHSYSSVLDLLREAAIDPDVTEIKITAYRLAPQSKIVNALINAVRNGKKVIVMLELRARFEEEANLEWKEILEEEGVEVLIGIPNMKVHAKLCLIKKRSNGRTLQYGFVSTGNLNEKTARIYGDYCLLTSNRNIMADINRVFTYLQQHKTGVAALKSCKTLIPCPVALRSEMEKLILREIKAAKLGKPSGIILKMNSLSDGQLIAKLEEAAKSGVPVQLIIRGICCMLTENNKFKIPVQAISIVDEYLEHARLFVFHNGGKEKVYLSSADWMVRNLDHRVEATCPVLDPDLKRMLKKIVEIQLSDNVKARILDDSLSNTYVPSGGKKKVRSQVEIYHYLQSKTVKKIENSSH